MFRSISIGAFMIIGASTLAYIVYRRCNATPRAVKTQVTAHNQLHSRSCATNAYTPFSCRQDWTAWQLHTSILTYLHTAHQLTIKQQRRLLFVRWLVRSGRLTEWITDTTEIEV